MRHGSPPRRIARLTRVAPVAPLALLAVLLSAACGPSHHRSAPFFDATGTAVGRAAEGATAVTWRAHAATALGTTETFFRTMPVSGGASVDRQAIIRTCSAALPNLPSLSLAVSGPYPDVSVERHVREALSGFSQYVEACAAGDDQRADEGFRYYDEGWQAASLAIGVQSSPDARLVSSP